MKNKIFEWARLRAKGIFRSLLLIWVSSSAGAFSQAAMPQRVVVSASKPDRLLVYQLNADTGFLSLESEANTSNAPGSMSFNGKGDRLYVSLKNPGSIATFKIDEESELTLLGSVDTEAYAGYLSVHRSGGFLFGSYYAAGQISVHRIEESGAIGEYPIQKIKTDNNAHAVVGDPSGNFLFVPHTRPNKIFQFRIDKSNGRLSASNSSFLIRDSNTGPRHLWFHPHLNVAYGSDEQGSGISSYRLNRKEGTLSLIETQSSLPSDFEEGNSTSDIEVHPSGKFVYIANRGHNSIAVFAIDETSGSLTFLEHTAVDPVPRSFNITPKGDFLIAAGQQTKSLRVFRIGENGRLVHTQTLSINGDPWWVVCQPR